MHRKLLITLVLLTAVSIAFAQAPPNVRKVGTATLENVPEIPAHVSEAVQKYQNYRAAVFQDWLADGSMLIATRFGTSQQIHRVAMPDGARTQLTFFNEPVASALAVPATERFVLTRDTGGDEWFQLYTMGLTGSPTRITEPGTRNLAPVFSKDGKLLAWSRAVKGSGDYAIFTADPANPASPRLVYQATGAVEPADISPDRSKLLFTRVISNHESKLLLLDLASGRVTEIAPKAGKVLYQNPLFSRNGGSVFAISDKDSDVRRLFEVDIATGRMTVVTPDLKWDVESVRVSDNGRILAYSVNEEGFSRVVIQDLVTRRALPQPELPRGVLGKMGFSPDGEKLAMSLSTATTSGDVWSWDISGGKLTRWTHSELGELDPANLVEPELVRFKSFDGLLTPAFVYRPKGVAANVRTPVIIDIHGGPADRKFKAAWLRSSVFAERS